MAGRVLNVADLWTPTPKNVEIRCSNAINRLRVGGTGSSKSSDALMEIVQNYMFRYAGFHALWLRRNLTDLRKSTILDFKEFVPSELYDFNETQLVFTLKHNGSKLFLGHLQHDSERDLQQYLSAAFPLINLDECAQLSGQAWQFLQTRNRINRECKKDQTGVMPVPCMLGETNPVGPHWSYYKAQFIDKKPYDLTDDMRRDKNGRYWRRKIDALGWNAENCELVYNPDDWAYVHSTILDNPHLMERDPNRYYVLQSLPKAERDKYLYGSLDTVVGQFFDCWDESLHVMDLTSEPDSIIWQPWQPRWIGWDWGRAHWTAVYWFTIALVKTASGEYQHKTVCYREYVDRGKDYRSLADAVYRLNLAGLPTDPMATSLSKIFLSHEQFNRKLNEVQAPALVISRHLTERGLPAATKFNAGPGTRVAKAALLYDMLKTQKLVVLSTCPNLIEAIPSMTRDEANLEDVLKVEGVQKSDDCYDAAASGLYSWYGKNSMPKEEQDRQRLEAIPDLFQRRLEQFKLSAEKEKRDASPYDERPVWMAE